MQRIVPSKALEVEEKSWNFFPFIRTVYEIKSVLGIQMTITAESKHLPDNGKTQNVHNLEDGDLKHRVVHMIDIAYDESIPTFSMASSPSSPLSSKAQQQQKKILILPLLLKKMQELSFLNCIPKEAPLNEIGRTQ